jgi:hypothetical protein
VTEQVHGRSVPKTFLATLIGHRTAQALAGRPATVCDALPARTTARLPPGLHPETAREALGQGLLTVTFDVGP